MDFVRLKSCTTFKELVVHRMTTNPTSAYGPRELLAHPTLSPSCSKRNRKYTGLPTVHILPANLAGPLFVGPISPGNQQVASILHFLHYDLVPAISRTYQKASRVAEGNDFGGEARLTSCPHSASDSGSATVCVSCCSAGVRSPPSGPSFPKPRLSSTSCARQLLSPAHSVGSVSLFTSEASSGFRSW